jgi:hypothetical protein
MFCPQCGHTIEEGKSFCPHCGAKLGGTAVPVPPAGPGGQAQGWSPPPPPPPPPGWNAGGGPGTETRSSRTLWIVLAIVGAFVILGGGGAAAWFFLVRDDGPDVITTSVTGTSTSSTTGGATTTRPQSTTVPGSSTTVTVPGHNPSSTSTSRATTTTSATAYLQAVAAMERALQKADDRIPQLADRINATAPNVPQDVYDELGALSTEVTDAQDQLAMVDPPEPWVDADSLLMEASTTMEYRIEMTMLGIEAMWDEGNVDAATYYFDEGRAARDQYRSTYDQYLKAKP